MKVTILGILAFLPLLVYGVLLYTFFSVALYNNGAILNSPYLPLIMISAPLAWGTIIYYVLHAVKNNELQEHKKILWILALIFMGLITLPLYWYKNIYKK